MEKSYQGQILMLGILLRLIIVPRKIDKTAFYNTVLSFVF